MFVGVREHLITEPEHTLVKTTPTRKRFPLSFFERSSQVIETADQKVLFIIEMCVECRAPDVGTVDNILD